MQTAKILEIVKTREYDYENKHYYATTLKLDNGDEGECSKAKPDFFTVGQSITYEIAEGKYAKKITLEKPNTQKQYGGGGYQKEDPTERLIGFAASYSKDLIVAKIVTLEQFENIADIFFDRMKNKLSNNRSQETQKTPQKETNTPVAQSTNSELITEEQRKYANALWTKTGNNRETWKNHILETYKKDSSTKLTKKEATEFIEYIKTLPVLPLPTATPADDDLPF